MALAYGITQARQRQKINKYSTHSAETIGTAYRGDCGNPFKVQQVTIFPWLVIDCEDKTFMSDYITGKFHACLRDGLIINNPMWMTRTILEDVGVDYHTMYSRLTNTYCGNGVWKDVRTEGYKADGIMPLSELTCKRYAPEPEISDAEIAAALTDAYANQNHAQTLAIQTLVEAEKTVSSLASIAGRVVKIAREVKSLNIRALAKEFSPKELADRYMSLRYSLRPLIGDMESSMKAAFIKPYSNRLVTRGKRKGIIKSETIEKVFESSVSIRYAKMKAETTYEVRAGVLSQSLVDSAIRRWGFYNWNETLWECLPLSFVIDWFINLGDVISSWAPTVGIRTLASWYVLETVHTATTSLYSFEYKPKSPDWNECKAPPAISPYATTTKVTKRVTRQPSPQQPILPVMKLSLNTWKLIDLLIILKNLRR